MATSKNTRLIRAQGIWSIGNPVIQATLLVKAKGPFDVARPSQLPLDPAWARD